MTKHDLNKGITTLVVAAIIVAHFVYDISLWYIIPILVLSMLTILYGVLNIDFNYFYTSYCKGRTSKKQIALSFDDGPSPNTLELLKVLEEKKIPASFFCIGKNIEENPDILRKIHEAKHIIGNHSYYHGDKFNLQNSEAVEKELKMTNDIIFKEIGVKPKLFRPPYGVSNPMLAKAIQRVGAYSIGWSVRSFDTFFKNENDIFKRITRQLKPGAIVLMHDNLDKTASLVSKLIDYCEKYQYEIVPLSELLEIDSYE